MSHLVHGPERVQMLKQCPVSVSNHSADIQKSLQTADLESKNMMIPIHVARTIDGETYVVDGQLRVDELKKRKTKTVEAYVHNVTWKKRYAPVDCVEVIWYNESEQFSISDIRNVIFIRLRSN